MKYVIDEVDLLTLLTKCKNDPNLPTVLLDDFLKSKKPIEEISDSPKTLWELLQEWHNKNIKIFIQEL